MLNSLIPIIASSGGAVAGAAYESIASAAGTGSSGTITFSSIPSTYVALQVRGIFRSTTAGVGLANLIVRFNSDTTNSNYSYHGLGGDGASVLVGGGANSPIYLENCYPFAGNLANSVGVTIIDVHNYASTTQNKTLRAFSSYQNNNADAGITPVLELNSGLWRNTGAINSITISGGSDNFTTTTSFALYGIKGA